MLFRSFNRLVHSIRPHLGSPSIRRGATVRMRSLCASRGCEKSRSIFAADFAACSIIGSRAVSTNTPVLLTNAAVRPTPRCSRNLMMQYEFRHSDSQARSSDGRISISIIGIAKELAHLSREHSFNMFAVTRPGEAAACGFLVIAA